MNDVNLNFSDDIAEIRLTRNAKRNALALSMIEKIISYQKEIANSAAKGVLISAEGNIFCAGHDFSEMAGSSESQMQSLFETCSRMMRGFQKLPQPVVAAVQGAAIGAGCQMALAADLVVLGESAFLQTPGGKGAWFCTTPMMEVMHNVAPKRALEMLFTGEPIDSETAFNWGMVNRIVKDADVKTESVALLNLASRGSPSSKEAGKQTYYKAMQLPKDQAYPLASKVMAETGASAEVQQVMQDIIDKKRTTL